MSKAIQSMDTALPSGGTARSSAGRRAGGVEAGGFSRLLSAGRAAQAERSEGNAVPECGRKLPEQAPRQSGQADPEREAVRDAAPATEGNDTGQAMADQPVDAPVQSAPVPDGTVEVPAELAGLLAGEAGTAPVAEPVTSEADDGVTAPAVTSTVAEPVADVTASADEAPAPAVDADDMPVAGMEDAEVTEPVPQVAAAVPGIEIATAQPDGSRGRPVPDPVAQAVREGMTQLQATPAAQGNGGEQAGADDNGQPAQQDPATGVVRGNGAGILSFSDTLIEAGSGQPSARVPVAVGQPGWGRAVGEQVVWFVSQNIQSASLKLNPQHLGPLELQLNVDGDRASIAFTSQHAAVREALETSLPRLRDMFAEQGLNLVNVNVSQQDGSRREQRAAGEGSLPSAAASGGDEPVPIVAGLAGAGTVRGLVDYYV